jgi:hypothetical protein
MSFQDRILASEIAVNMFDAWCHQRNLIFGKSGYENWGNDGFKNRIRQLDDTTAKRIRFFPDRTILGEKGAQLVEVKNSTTIEKDAYDTYMDLYRTSYHVGIIFRNEEFLGFEYGNQSIVRLLYCDINNLQAKVPEDKYLTKYGMRLPVEGDVWITPRNLSPDEYQKWKSNSPGSGTAYALIDFEVTRWNILWNEIDDGNLGVPIRKE